MIDSSATIDAFLTAAAAKQPTPGGGSVASLVGALAASMGEMVLQYSVGKKDLLPHKETNERVLHELTKARLMLAELIREDQDAYEAYNAAKKSNAPAAEFQAIVQTCIRVPLAIGATALAVLELADGVVKTSNRWLLSDLAVCGELALATIRCAAYNVRVNLGELSDANLKTKFRAESDHFVTEGVRLIQQLIPAIEAIQNS